MWGNQNCLIIGYHYYMLYLRMAYRQIGGQANHVSSWDVPGGQARKALGGQARAYTYTAERYKNQVSYKQPFNLPIHRRCDICSYNQLLGQEKRVIKHKHFSSKAVRECQGVEKQSGDYFCPTCKRVHTSLQTGRLKICLSSSTLHEFWAPRGGAVIYEGDAQHIDYITIPGAKIIDLVEAWKIEYFQERRGMDVFLIGGLNNIVKGYKPESIMRDYDHMVQVVKYQAEKFHPTIPNTCSIATLFYPPQLCWFPDQGKVPPGFINHLEDMRWINGEVERLNFESDIKVPNFTTFGLRVGNHTTKDKYGYVSVNHPTTHT